MLLQALDTGSAGWINDLVMRTEFQPSVESLRLARGAASQCTSSSASVGSTNCRRVKLHDLEQGSRSKPQVQVQGHAARQARHDRDSDRSACAAVNDYPSSLLSTLIISGESALAYDGQYFFDADHSEGAGGTLSEFDERRHHDDDGADDRRNGRRDHCRQSSACIRSRISPASR